jgi:hypothetical protein
MRSLHANFFGKISTLICLVLMFGGCSNNDHEESFEFVLKYGVMYKNELNTNENTFTKDLVMDGVVTTDLTLTGEQKNDIRMLMERMDIESYRGMNEGKVMEPSSGFQFDIQWKGKQLLIDWIGGFGDDSKAVQMQELTQLIIEMVESNEAYKQLPPIQGGYL